MRTTTRWEYRRRTAFLWNEMAILREMGDEGWELAGVWGLFLYFKRALPA
jgi:hypothetical protein